MTATRFKKAGHCPTCGTYLDAVTPTDPQHPTPEAGDFSICFGCGELLIFTDPPFLRLPTPEEVEAAKSNPESWAEVRRAQEAVQHAKAMRSFLTHFKGTKE